MKAILAVNNLGFIGLNDGLPWPKCKEDFKLFKSLTMGCSVLVGYRTMKTLPPLKDRVVYMDFRDSVSESIDWCIGGKKTYEKYCHLFTHINDNTIGDTTFPDLSNLNPNCKIFNYHFDVE